jgi:type II secretory pathway pseudopilin PulG
MEIVSLIVVIAIACVVAALVAWRPLRRFSRQVQLERAREGFRLQRERLEAKFLQAAQATGKPRGLRWQHCHFDSDVTFVRDKQTGEIAALVGVTVHFEAIQGSDMEDNPNVSHPRSASAVFFFHKGHWNTVGKTVFNMSPIEALEHFKNQYERAAS